VKRVVTRVTETGWPRCDLWRCSCRKG